jgi:hypothetical protein
MKEIKYTILYCHSVLFRIQIRIRNDRIRQGEKFWIRPDPNPQHLAFCFTNFYSNHKFLEGFLSNPLKINL